MLSPEQYEAIKYLAQPKQGGFTLAEIAEKVGVSERTIYNWKNSEAFQKEFKRIVLKHSYEDMPEIMEAVKKAIVENRNAAMFRHWAEVQGLIKGDKGASGQQTDAGDIEDMKRRIEEYRNRNNKDKIKRVK